MNPRTGTADSGDRVLGVDSGGSGLRLALARPFADGSPREDGPPRETARREDPEPVTVATAGPAAGIDAEAFLARLLPAVRTLLAEDTEAVRVTAVCVGAAGMATLGTGLRARLPGALARELGVRRVALAADAVTAYAGALGERPGAVVAAGTGMIGIGTDLERWQRADGWGHLLGDCGGGAWIGRAGLEAALRAHDGRTGGSPALLARAEKMFGPAAELPGRLYPRSDRPAVLASFAPEVARCAGGTAPDAADPVAAAILRQAAREIAATAAAVCPADTGGAPPEIALTGGLLRLGEPLTAPLRAGLTEAVPHARTVTSAGEPLDGALLIAARLASGERRLPADSALLSLHGDDTTRVTGH